MSLLTYFDKILYLILFFVYKKMLGTFGRERSGMMPVIKADFEEKQISHFVIVFVVVRL